MHEHEHEHSHPHEHGDIPAFDSLEQAEALMSYMLDHNRHHADELHEVGHKLAHTGKEEAAKLQGMNCGALKEAASETVIAALAPIQERYQALMGDKDYISNVLRTNAERAHYLAQKTLRKVYKKLGLYQG